MRIGLRHSPCAGGMWPDNHNFEPAVTAVTGLHFVQSRRERRRLFGGSVRNMSSEGANDPSSGKDHEALGAAGGEGGEQPEAQLLPGGQAPPGWASSPPGGAAAPGPGAPPYGSLPSGPVPAFAGPSPVGDNPGQPWAAVASYPVQVQAAAKVERWRPLLNAQGPVIRTTRQCGDTVSEPRQP